MAVVSADCSRWALRPSRFGVPCAPSVSTVPRQAELGSCPTPVRGLGWLRERCGNAPVSTARIYGCCRPKRVIPRYRISSVQMSDRRSREKKLYRLRDMSSKCAFRFRPCCSAIPTHPMHTCTHAHTAPNSRKAPPPHGGVCSPLTARLSPSPATAGEPQHSACNLTAVRAQGQAAPQDR